MKNGIKGVDRPKSICEVIIREAVVGDAENLAVLKQQVWISTYAVEGIRQEFSSYVLSEFSKDQVHNVLLQKQNRTLLAILNGHIVGCIECCLKASSPDGILPCCPEITVLYVLDGFSGQGVGYQLLMSALELIKNKGYNKTWLSVYHENKRAINFYQANQFNKGGEIFFELDTNKYKNWVMLRMIE